MSAHLEKLIRESGLNPSTCVLRHLTRTSRLIVAVFDSALSPVGLTGHQFGLLMVLASSDAMTVKSLAAEAGIHPSTVPRLLAPLLRRGMAKRRVGTDRRERFIAITREGNAAVLRAYPRWAKAQKAIVTQLGEAEWASTMQGLKNIRRSVAQFSLHP